MAARLDSIFFFHAWRERCVLPCMCSGADKTVANGNVDTAVIKRERLRKAV